MSFLVYIHNFFYKNRSLTLLIFGIVFLISGYLSSKITFRKELLDILPPSHPTVIDYRLFLKHFSPLETLTIALRPVDQNRNLNDVSTLILTADKLALDLTASNLFSNIAYDQSQEDLTGLLAVLFGHAGAYFEEENLSSAKFRLTEEGIRQQLTRWRQLLQTNPAPQLSQVFYLDPFGISPHLTKRLEMFGSWASEFNLEHGRFLSKDKTSALLFAQAKRPASDGTFSEEVTKLLMNKQQELRLQGWHLAFMGSHRFSFENARQIKSDVESSSLISLIAIIAFAMLVFRRRILPIFAMLPLFWGLAVASAICYLVIGSISIVALACGSLLVGVAVDYGIHVLYHLDEQENLSLEQVNATMQHLVRPLVATASISSLAFLCLLLSSLPIYREFCLFAVTGLWASLFATIYLLPALVSLLPAINKTSKPIFDLTEFVKITRQRSTRYLRNWPKNLAIALTLVLGAGLSQLHIDADPQSLYSANKAITQDAREINKMLSGSMRTNSIIIQGRDLNDAYAKNDALYSIVEEHRDSLGIIGLQSVAPFIKSEHKEKENITRWQNLWNPAQSEIVRKAWKNLATELHLKPERLSEVMHQYQIAGVGAKLEDFTNTSLAKFFHRYIAADQAPFILTTFRLHDDKKIKDVEAMLQNNNIEYTLVNMTKVVTEIMQLIYREFMLLGIVTGLAILLVLSFMFGTRQGWNMTGPLLLSLVWTFGAMGWFGVSINILNSIVTLFVFGLVIDYSVFLFSSSDAHEDRTLASIFMSGVTTIFGVLALVFAQHQALKNIALTVLIGVLMGLLSTTIWSSLAVKNK